VLKEFRDFVLRGNLVDLAVAVVIGTAFAAVIKELTESFITPLIAAIGGQPDFAALMFTINGSTFTYGQFFNALVNFLIVAAVVFFLVIKPTNHLIERVRGPVEEDRRECPECLSSIPTAARRCAHCTAQVQPAA
jgi:large conductance mechanosensitive channel